MKPVLRLIAVLFVVLVFADTSVAQDASEEVSLNSWLALGPVTMPMPAFHDEDGVEGQPYDVQGLLEFCVSDIREWEPVSGEQLQWDRETLLEWQHAGSVVEPQQASDHHPEFAWAATYVEIDRWASVEVELSSHHPFKAFLNGQSFATSTAVQDAGDEASTVTETLELEQGKHLIVVQLLKDPQSEAAWSFSGSLTPDNPEDVRPEITADPDQRVSMSHITDAPQVASLRVSPDGEFVAVTVSQDQPPEGDTESFIELRETETGDRIQTYAGGMDVSALGWAPEGEKRFTYVDRTDNGADLWLVDLENGTQERLIEDVEDFGSYTWSPTGDFIIYSRSEEPPEDDSGIRRLEYMEERRPWFETRSFLYRLNVPEGTQQRLTAGGLTTNLNGISPDGEQLVFSRSHIDYDERPFSKTEFGLLDLSSLEVDSLFTRPFAGSAQWSPDGEQLLFTGGPSMFGELGQNLPPDRVANDYDTQAYLYDLSTENITPVTYDFDPSVSQITWSAHDGNIYLTTTDRSFVNLYRYNAQQEDFEHIQTNKDVLHQVDIARDAPVAAYAASGAQQRPTSYLLDLQNGTSRDLVDPAAEEYKNVRFGDVQDWTFTNERGEEIEGHVYYPPDFDPAETYPVIVYYYGGTTPVTRSYAGRYPKELWAAKDYLVYVLQPSGAIGFGQEFSSFHVNDWGQIVADEIISGVSQFLEAHEYASNERVGAIGASFGGFMTMLLQTRTDMFGAAVSHAGISNITSYWGEGFWGFQYSALATADSYPWNRPDVYVEQSPIYHADEITTPMLLITGDADTNVPAGESIQMFTALRLLGQDVDYVEVEGQDHHIVDYNKYIDWANTILAYFDRHLKDEPEWWNTMYD